MADENPTPTQRQQNKINTERALRDNGVRLGDLRASMVAQQQQARETGLRTGSLTTTGLQTGSLRTGSLGTSFPAKPFSAPTQEGGDQGAPVDLNIDAVILNSNGTIYTGCTLSGTLGEEA